MKKINIGGRLSDSLKTDDQGCVELVKFERVEIKELDMFLADIMQTGFALQYEGRAYILESIRTDIYISDLSKINVNLKYKCIV